MKKKLEAELISIAHRILKMKGKSDVVQLHREASVLYEKLSVLRFVEEEMGEVKPTIGRGEALALLEESFGKPEETTPPDGEDISQAVETVSHLIDEKEPEQLVAESEEDEPENDPGEDAPEELPEIEIEEPAVEQEPAPVEEAPEVQKTPEETPLASEEPTEERKPQLEDEIFKPAFEWVFEPKEPQEPQSAEPTEKAEDKDKLAQAEIAFEDLLGPGYKDPVFVKTDEASGDSGDAIPISRSADKVQVIKMSNTELADRTVSLNDRLSRGITVGLNDRIAFVKHLFNNSSEDYNRVLSQLITFASLDEAREFIETMVKPDYNNWAGKEEYEARFMEVVERKFA